MTYPPPRDSWQDRLTPLRIALISTGTILLTLWILHLLESC